MGTFLDAGSSTAVMEEMSPGKRLGSFALLDYVGSVSKTQLKVGVNIHELSRNLDLKAGCCQEADSILITETQI